MPENLGERREVLRILEKVNYSKGLLDMIASDKEVSLTLKGFVCSRTLTIH